MEQDIPKDLTTEFIGAWRLVSSEMQEVGGKIIQQDTVGCLIYDERGYMSAQSFMSGTQLTGTPEEIKSALEVSASYFGTYEVNREKGSVVHHVEASLLPIPRVGMDMERFFEFSGDRLILTTPPMQVGDREVVLVFSWERAGKSRSNHGH